MGRYGKIGEDDIPSARSDSQGGPQQTGRGSESAMVVS